MDKIIVTTTTELKAFLMECVHQQKEEKIKDGKASFYPQKPLTLKEAALFLNLSPKTLYGYTSKKKIPFIKRGKLYFYLHELEAWLKEGSQKQMVEGPTKQEGLLPFRSGRKRPL